MRWIVRLELCDTGMLSAAELLTKMRTVLTYAAGRLSSRAAPPAAPSSARTSTTTQKRRTTDDRFGCCIPTPVQVAATSVAGGRDVEVPWASSSHADSRREGGLPVSGLLTGPGGRRPRHTSLPGRECAG